MDKLEARTGQIEAQIEQVVAQISQHEALIVRLKLANWGSNEPIQGAMGQLEA